MEDQIKSPLVALKQELEGAKDALSYFVKGLAWANQNVQMWQTHINETHSVIENLEQKINQYEDEE